MLRILSSLFGEKVEFTRFGIVFHAVIPSVVKIDIRESVEELVFFVFVEFSHSGEDLRNAHLVIFREKFRVSIRSKNRRHDALCPDKGFDFVGRCES